MAIKSKIISGALLLTIIFNTSCETSRRTGVSPLSVPDKPFLNEERKIVSETKNGLSEEADNILKSSNSIDKHADDIRANIPRDQLPDIKPSLEGIENDTDALRETRSQLIVYTQRLEDAEGQLVLEQKKIDEWTDYAVNSESKNRELQDRINTLKNESAQQFKKTMMWIGTVCVVGIGICIALAIWLKSATAFMVALGFGATLAVSVAVTLYMQTIAMITIIVFGVAIACVAIYFGWHFYQSKKTEEELVHTGEVTKQYLSPESREKLFGVGAEPGTVSLIQSNTTKRRVKQIKHYNEKRRLNKTAPRLPKTYRPPEIK